MAQVEQCKHLYRHEHEARTTEGTLAPRVGRTRAGGLPAVTGPLHLMHQRSAMSKPSVASHRAVHDESACEGMNQRTTECENEQFHVSRGRTTFAQAPRGRTSSPYYTSGESPHPKSSGSFSAHWTHNPGGGAQNQVIGRDDREVTEKTPSLPSRSPFSPKFVIFVSGPRTPDSTFLASREL